MKIAGIIPARWASARFPGKPLAKIKGKTMIHRVYGQCLKCQLLDKVIIATDDIRIMDEVESFGGLAMMTSTRHESGTERCGEVVEKLEQQNEGFDAIINIQGDEPFIDPEQISKVVRQLEKENIQTRVIFTGNILKQPGFKNIECKKAPAGYPNADKVMKNGILLACHHGLTNGMLEYVHQSFRKFSKKYS